MSYKSNPQYLPPKKSADEYEREIALLKLQLQEAETTIKKAHVDAANYFFRKTDLDLFVEEIKKNE
jgi:hypothetical protein